MVATTIKSISSAVIRAASIARKAARAPRSEVNSSFEAMWRSLIPVREVIHSSEVFTIFSRSALVRTRAGTYDPTPAMEQVRPWKLNLARGFLNLGLVVGLMMSRQVYWSAFDFHTGKLIARKSGCRRAFKCRYTLI